MNEEARKSEILRVVQGSLVDVVRPLSISKKRRGNLWDSYNKSVKSSGEYAEGTIEESKDMLLSMLDPYLVSSEISKEDKFDIAVARYMTGAISLVCGGTGLIAVSSSAPQLGAVLVFSIAAVSASIYSFPLLKKIAFRRGLSSRNPRKLLYNTNKLLEVLIRDKVTTTEFFESPEILGYALWISEKSLPFVSSGSASSSGSVSKSVLKDSDYDKFMNDPLYISFMNLAKDMCNEESPIVRQRIPYNIGFSGNSKPNAINDFRIYKTYPEIFLARSFDFHVADKQDKQSIHATELEGDSIMVENFDLEFLTLNKVEKEWLDSQTDIVQLLTYPMLTDMGEPSVKEFYRNLSYAKLLASKKLTADFSSSVSNLEASWNSVLHEAKKMHLSKFDDGERKKILMATNLMRIALNAASTPSERQSAYKKAMGQLQGLIVVPKSAIFAIEQSVSKPELIA